MSEILIILGELNNREIASIFWIIIIIFVAIWQKSIRDSVVPLIRTFFHRAIIVPLIFMLIYISGIIYVLIKVKFWDITATADTVIWFLGTALALFFRSANASKDQNYFKLALIDILKFTIIFEYVVNLYSFNLIIELITLPIIIIFITISGYSSEKKEYNKIKLLLDKLISIYGLIVLAFTIRSIWLDFNNFVGWKNLRDFLLIPFLSLSLLPFIYLLALYSEYEVVYSRVEMIYENYPLKKYLKRKIANSSKLNLWKIHKFTKYMYKFTKTDNKADIQDKIKLIEDPTFPSGQKNIS